MKILATLFIPVVQTSDSLSKSECTSPAPGSSGIVSKGSTDTAVKRKRSSGTCGSDVKGKGAFRSDVKGKGAFCSGVNGKGKGSSGAGSGTCTFNVGSQETSGTFQKSFDNYGSGFDEMLNFSPISSEV